MRRTHPVPLSSVLNDIIDRQHMRGRMSERKAVSAWSIVVGDSMAMRAIAIEARQGTLMLRCNIPVIRQEIMLNRAPLIRKLNELCGDDVIADIRFI